MSFYYQGLTLVQFKQAFDQLLKSDEPSIEYDKWVTNDLPDRLRDFHSINVEDSSQLSELHEHVRYVSSSCLISSFADLCRLDVSLIDFYLNNLVFPKHAKQFMVKLQASSWDLILTDPTGAPACRTTGFSGTNDCRHQLPLTIEQNNELKKLAHTNAEVLSYLLASRNRQYVQAVDGRGKRLSEVDLLKKLFKISQYNRIRVLIDAGAQVLEHNNRDLAAAWLQIDTEAAAAVYFDESHKPMVRYRKGKTLPLVASPFAENLENCVVYLDESHCRGTDLKLPANARAALTLGSHVTKDALTQAAMRLRLLGETQAVTFFAPPEVHQNILDLRASMVRGRQIKRDITSKDVIAWLLKQSCDATEQLEPLYCTQGQTYLEHMQAKSDNLGFLQNSVKLRRYLSVLQSKELQTLKSLYEPKHATSTAKNDAVMALPMLQNFATALSLRKSSFQDGKSVFLTPIFEEVEQEREIEHEVESVREIQLPTHFKAHKICSLHQDIREFCQSGSVFLKSEAYQPMFEFLKKTTIGSAYSASFNGLHHSKTMLLVSTQYARTVKTKRSNDNFLRPCHWLLLNTKTGQGLAVSPEEGDQILSLLRKSSQAQVNLIVYSAPVTRRMLHFNSLNYHATPWLPEDFDIPQQLKIEWEIFAGRLYFEWSEYEGICRYLGVSRTVGDDAQEQSATPTIPLTFGEYFLI